MNQTWELSLPISAYEARGFAVLHVPTVDYGAPSPNEVDRAVAFVCAHVDK